MRAKTPSGRRSIPLFALVPALHRDALLAYWEKRWRDVSHTPDPLSAPFFVDESGQRMTEGFIADRITDALTARAGKGHSLHTLRHAGASWFVITWFCAIYGRPTTHLGFDLSHPLFLDDHLAQFRRLFIPEDAELRGNGLEWSTDPCHALSRCLGHATPRTTIETYVQTLPLLHYYFLERRKTSDTRGAVPQVFSRRQVQHLTTSSSTKVWALFTRDATPGPVPQSDAASPESCLPGDSIPLTAILSHLRTTYLDITRRALKPSSQKASNVPPVTSG